MSEIAVLVLLDAFRPDYLFRTGFLRSLSRRGGVGAMEEPFGFVPRAAYFGGLTPNQTGYANIFVREPWRSPFPAVPDMSRLKAAFGTDTVRTSLVAEAQARSPDFAARYLDAFAVPVGDLPAYAIGETLPPWGARCGYRSLFHILDRAQLEWVQCAWPYTRGVAAADPGIVATFLERLGDTTRFGFVHLSSLDAVGHDCGPGSIEMQAALDEIDAQCALLHATLHERFDRVRLLFFGDHGMVTVVRQAGIRAELARAGFEPDGRVAMFVDSPMVRFWFHDDAAHGPLVAALSALDCGTVLAHADLARYDADRMAGGNGELYFVAHPGVVFAPNAFQDGPLPVRGMHGYLPDVPDNRGLLLSYDSADRRSGSLGIAKATQLFPTCLHMCGIDPTGYTTIPRLQLTPQREQWTTQGDPAHEARVDADLARARARLASRAPASAIVVTGSFGRGEGGVVDGAAGVEVLNDYDLVVIGADALATADQGRPLAVALRTDFCDVLPYASVASLRASQLHFDLRYGSRVIAGDRRALERMPRYAPASIPVSDAALLLMNRAAGVMLVSLPEQRGLRGPLTQFAVNQLGKALTAAGDAYLIAAGDYTTRCRDREARFSALAAAIGVPPEARVRISMAYRYKLASSAAPGPFEPDDFVLVRDVLQEALRQLPIHAGPAGWPDAVDAALAEVVVDPEADEAWCRERVQRCGLPVPPVRVNGEPREPGLRRAILSGIAALFRSTPGLPSAGDWTHVVATLASVGAPLPVTDHLSLESETARQHLAAAWLAIHP